MAAGTNLLFSCTECGARQPKWTGQCLSCGAWNSLVESVAEAAQSNRHRHADHGGPAPVSRMSSVLASAENRLSSGVPELDRVLGGGLVLGSVVLLGGDPGIGKSTLLLQSLGRVNADVRTMYVTGEESPQQIALRAERLGVDGSDMLLLAETGVERIIDTAASERPRVIVIDSIQTLYTDHLQSAPGSVAQVRETAAQLVRYAKLSETVMVLVGHVTKEGALAGPRVLEHMVDTVLYFEGDRASSFRLVRAFKNRFGAVNEIGVFAMTDRGLKEVINPSAMFVGADHVDLPGSVTLATQEGSRPLLVEVQALVDRSPLANPRRLTVGLESSRLAMLLAVLHRHVGCALYDHDVFVSVVGGVRVFEPAADLAICVAIVSSLQNRPVPGDTLVFGEVGLAGEIRPVQRGVDRLREAQKLGYARALIPQGNVSRHLPAGIAVISAADVAGAIGLVFD